VLAVQAEPHSARTGCGPCERKARRREPRAASVASGPACAQKRHRDRPAPAPRSARYRWAECSAKFAPRQFPRARKRALVALASRNRGEVVGPNFHPDRPRQTRGARGRACQQAGRRIPEAVQRGCGSKNSDQPGHCCYPCPSRGEAASSGALAASPAAGWPYPMGGGAPSGTSRGNDLLVIEFRRGSYAKGFLLPSERSAPSASRMRSLPVSAEC